MQFFLQGTQLSKSAAENQAFLENTQHMAKILVQKKKALPGLLRAREEVKARFEEVSKAREQKQRVHDLEKELVWSQVQLVEDKMSAKVMEVAKLEGGLKLLKLKEKAGTDDYKSKLDKQEEDLRAAQTVSNTLQEGYKVSCAQFS